VASRFAAASRALLGKEQVSGAQEKRLKAGGCSQMRSWLVVQSISDILYNSFSALSDGDARSRKLWNRLK